MSGFLPGGCPIVEAARLLHGGGPWLAAELLAAESEEWALLHGMFCWL